MSTSMSLDSGSSSSSEEMVVEPITQVGQAIEIIDRVISRTVTWNKHQCKRIADRYNAIGEKFKSMGWHRNLNGGDASDGGPIFDELVKILKKGLTLVESYAASQGITSAVLSRTDNREAFEEIHEGLDTVEAKFGFQSFEEEIEVSPDMEKLNMKEDAENDKKDMPEIFSQQQTTGMDHFKELAQVVSEKTALHMDVEKLVASDEHALPSYLTIDLKSDSIEIKGKRIREYVRQSEQDLKEEEGWAAVHPGKWLGCDFAMKVFKCSADAGRAAWNQRQLLMEVGSLVKLQHPHVVRLVGFGQDEEECVIVMELMDDNLRYFMKVKQNPGKPFTDTEEVDIISQIAKGMYYMHERGYAHGELKCSNILVKNFGDQYLEVKISDLRGSQKLDEDSDSKGFEHARKTRRPRWTAPEAIHQNGGNRPSKELLKQNDVYSFGMTCYEIVTGKYPFNDINGRKLLEQIDEGAAKWNPLPDALDEGLKHLITSCWNMDPSKRPNFVEICLFLDFIRSRKLAEEESKSCGVTIGAMLSQFKQIPAVKRVFTQVESLVHGRSCKRVCTEVRSLEHGSGSDPSQVRLLRSDSHIEAPPHLTILPHHELERVERIGQGSSGRVFKATWLGCTFAVKILKSHSVTQDLQKEVDFLIKVSRHPCIMQMVGLSKNSNGEHSIVMEYMDGNLRKLIDSRLKNRQSLFARKKGPFTCDEEVLIITKIALGMAYLHSRGLVHRDLNSNNVLAQDFTTTVDVKIVDFGRSHLEAETSNSSESHDFYKGEGTGYYRAPEMLPIIDSNEILPAELPAKSSKADLNALKATDVYSFGMLCYEVFTGEHPCADLKKLTEYAKVREGHRPKWPLDPRPELKVLVESCWHIDPKKRPTFQVICNVLQRHFQKQPRI